GTFAGAVGTINITTPANSASQAAFDQEKIAMRSGEIWPSAGLQMDFMASLATASGGGQHGIISLTGACDCYQNRDLEASGLARQSYLPGRHAYGLISKNVDLANPDIAGLVEHISPLEPEDKVDPNVLVGNYAIYGMPTGNFVDNGDGTLELAVLFARDVSVTDAQTILTIEAVSHSAISDHWWQVTLDALDVRDLAAYDEVEWIDSGLMPHIEENDNTRALVGVDALQTATINAGAITYAGLTGNGINVGVDDSGLDTAHPDLNVVGTISPVNPPSSPHGTHVGGIVAGSGANSNQNDANGNPNGGTAFQWRGMAPNAGLIDSSDLINLGNLLNAINNFSLDISNHSHGVSVDGAYDAANQTIDQAIRGGGTSGGNAVPRRPQVYSAGNNGVNPANPGNQRGYFSTTKQMKNAVFVGNWDTGQNDLSRTSSMGPAYDGRIKPDLVAPGSNTAPGAANITSTGTTGNANSCYANNLNQGYGPCSGTSMASPAVAGIMALMLEAWEDTYDVDVDDNPPLPSTLKALLIQTATDIVDNDVRSNTLVEIDSDSNGANGNDGAGRATATVGPDYATGWGLVNASSAVALLQDTRDEGGSVPVPNRIIQDAVNQATVREYDFVVDTMQDIKVTLAWDDMEAAIQNIANGPMLVNDLDLELEAPDGTIYYPWKLGQVIQDNNGVVIADAAQTPGTNITVSLPINPTQNPAAGNDYVPAGALTGNGTWVAGTGKDHLNNVEQVFVNGAQAGHWTLRVT
ncbi:MAG: S8 family serine peptidase, partial [SAR202 cluster bacterium]|nr:S8 family serine peptidase [SAR202 cluster bacterium]